MTRMMRNSETVCRAVSEPEDPRRLTGILGEAAAERHLRSVGMRILARGFRFRGGEIDLIAQDGEDLVFVEVKTRTTEEFGSPAESVTPTKRRKLVQAASCYLQSRGAWQHPCRFDVISICLGRDGSLRLDHLRDAFRADR